MIAGGIGAFVVLQRVSTVLRRPVAEPTPPAGEAPIHANASGGIVGGRIPLTGWRRDSLLRRVVRVAAREVEREEREREEEEEARRAAQAPPVTYNRSRGDGWRFVPHRIEVEPARILPRVPVVDIGADDEEVSIILSFV